MKIIVTGATSFIGSHMVIHLLSKGHTVYGIVRPHSPHWAQLRDRLSGVTQPDGGGPAGRFEKIDLDMDGLDRLPGLLSERDFYGWVHAGWDGAGSENRKNRDIQQRNVEHSLKGLRAARELGCERFLFTGSQAEYGICRDVMRECDVCRPVSEYGKAKVDFCRRAGEVLNQELSVPTLRYVHARIFSVYGPGDHPGSLVESCLKACLADGELLLGACCQMWNYLYIEDLVQALHQLLFHPGVEAGVYNVAGSPEETRPLRDYVELIRKACHGRGKLTFGERPPHAEGMANLIPDTAKLSRAAGWKPQISFEDGIRRMVEERENGTACL